MTEPVTHEALLIEIKALREAVTQMREEMALTRDLVQAYQAVKTGGAFITWAAKVIGGIVLVLALWRYGFEGLAAAKQ